MTYQMAIDIAQTSTIAVAAIVVAAIVAAGVVGAGVYRVRYAATRDQDYRTLVERSTDSAQATADELKGVRAELGDVRQRLAALEQLLSQIG
jgi:hypothetical protein